MNWGVKVLSSRCLWECMDRTIDVGSQHPRCRHLLGACDGAGSEAHPNQELYLDWIPRGSVGEADSGLEVSGGVWLMLRSGGWVWSGRGDGCSCRFPGDVCRVGEREPRCGIFA